MAKIYDIVETSQMSMENDGALINVQGVAKTDLENGRLVTIKDGKVEYAKESDTEILLHASVEKMADTSLGLTEFIAKKDKKVRVLRMRKGDLFKTTAIEGVVAVKETVTVGANGQFKKLALVAGTENFVGEVMEVGTLGFDRTKAIKIKVLKA